MNNLLESGILGNYTQCAVIEIFGIEKSKIFNIYTICTFEESKSVNEEKSYLTERLCPFFNREDIKWGIIKRTLSIDAMNKCLDEIEESHCLMWNDKEGISLENLELIERQYICGEEGRISPLNRILKNNFTQGSYIKGDMAIVGPRPLLVQYLPRYNERQHHRHDVRPGFTGLAQVNGRNSISWQEKFEWDVRYVENVSFLMDLRIIAKTVKVVLKRDGISSETSATMEEFRGNE